MSSENYYNKNKIMKIDLSLLIYGLYFVGRLMEGALAMLRSQGNTGCELN